MTAETGVFEAFLAVLTDVEAIGKNRRVTEGPARFAFRGVDDVMAALHGPMALHGLICVPQVMERLQETRQTRNGGTMNVTHLRVRFGFYGADGSSFHAETWGEGQDSGDKSTGKAHSMAYKSALLQAFHIPVEDTPDADFDTTPATPRVTDMEWRFEFETRVQLADSRAAVAALVAEAQRVYAEGNLTLEDARLLKSMTDARDTELAPA